MSRARLLAAATIAAWAAIGIGTFQTFYLRIYARDRAQLAAQLTELPYRQIPGLRTLLSEAAARTPPGARILIVLPHRQWQRGYGYGFRRAQYVLAGRTPLPLLDRNTDRVDPRSLARADFVLCWRGCTPPPAFATVWQSSDGSLLRRTR